MRTNKCNGKTAKGEKCDSTNLVSDCGYYCSRHWRQSPEVKRKREEARAEEKIKEKIAKLQQSIQKGDEESGDTSERSHSTAKSNSTSQKQQKEAQTEQRHDAESKPESEPESVNKVLKRFQLAVNEARRDAREKVKSECAKQYVTMEDYNVVKDELLTLKAEMAAKQVFYDKLDAQLEKLGSLQAHADRVNLDYFTLRGSYELLKKAGLEKDKQIAQLDKEVADLTEKLG
ncbi:hypothetical protein CYMTET_43442 [Cymbomonas tetramitiformis]|uniref:Uncharacterized protein n=1 Tax=Cymbomonas tetramitiformis TaxID=36881 RepID=A0AAE0C397_9CHLO|nr:hypothetical protein CYMTET_43442 [Cymbomonas tetramitiformis]